jgi:hypothetical protein
VLGQKIELAERCIAATAAVRLDSDHRPITEHADLSRGREAKVRRMWTIWRNGSRGAPDIFGSQQYCPLLDIEVPHG